MTAARKPKSKMRRGEVGSEKDRWILHVAYKGMPDRKKEKQISDIVGGSPAGSGFDFRTGYRDLDWIFLSKKAVDDVATDLRAAFKRQLRVSIEKALTQAELEAHWEKVRKQAQKTMRARKRKES